MSEADAAAEAEARDDDAHTARLREVLRMAAEHRSQRDIASRFGVCVRTVRNWIAEAHKRRLGTFRQTTAEHILAEHARQHGTVKAGLLRRMNAAEVRGDDRLWLGCVKLLQAGQRDFFDTLERVGVFDSYRVPAPGAHDPDHETPQQVQQSLRGIVEHLLTGKPLEDDASTPDDTDADDAPIY
jgi:DNA-binding CsgD family transcriptional regulator